MVTLTSRQSSVFSRQQCSSFLLADDGRLTTAFIQFCRFQKIVVAGGIQREVPNTL